MPSNTTTTHGRHSRYCCLAKGLFRSLQRGERKMPLNIVYEVKPSSFHFKGPQRLGAEDLRVLQGVVALASMQQHPFFPLNPRSEHGKKLANLIKATDNGDGEELLYCAAKTTVYRLAAEIGYSEDGGDQRRVIIDALDRMAQVTIVYDDESERYPMDFLGYHFMKSTGEILIAVNPQIARAIWREDNFVHIDMNEIRCLKSAPARILHQRLCAIVDPGKERPFFIKTLAGYVWPEEAYSASTMRTRRATIREVIVEIGTLEGWRVSQMGKNKVVVARRKYRN